MRWLLLLGALALLSCRGPRTDQERLRERVDTLSVHLYVAAKLAVLTGERSPEGRAARQDLLALFAAAERVRSGDPGAPAEPTPTLQQGLSDLGSLALALWRLRADGARVVRSPAEQGIEPLLPVLLLAVAAASHGPPPLELALLDLNTEHALLLLTEFSLKLDERAGVPVPEEWLLYEAYRTDPERVRLEGLAAVVHGARAVLYARNDLCDLARADTQALEQTRERGAGLARGLRRLTRGAAALDAERAENLERDLALLGHGMNAACYLGRGDSAHALQELRRFVDGLEAAGVARSRLLALRAWLAWEDGDREAAERAVLEARAQQSELDPDSLAVLGEVERSLRSGDHGVARRALTRARLAAIAARILYAELRDSGLLEDLRRTEAVRAAQDWATTITAVVERGRGALPRAEQLRLSVPSAEEAARTSRGWLERLRRR